jgi:hypothetical protein
VFLSNDKCAIQLKGAWLDSCDEMFRSIVSQHHNHMLRLLKDVHSQCSSTFSRSLERIQTCDSESRRFSDVRYRQGALIEVHHGWWNVDVDEPFLRDAARSRSDLAEPSRPLGPEDDRLVMPPDILEPDEQ